LVIFVFILLSTPLVSGLISAEKNPVVELEKRPPYELAHWKIMLKQLSTLPSHIDSYLDDKFGLRSEMIRAYANLTFRLFGDGNEKVLVGTDKRMFYMLDNAVLQSDGLLLRRNDIDDTIKLDTSKNLAESWLI
jgi:hypothetical protein